MINNNILIDNKHFNSLANMAEFFNNKKLLKEIKNKYLINKRNIDVTEFCEKLEGKL